MFTGIVEGTAGVVELVPREQGRRLVLEGLPRGMTPGQSIAINGTCLTVAWQGEGREGFDLAGETLRCTNLGELRPGDRVNFERALALGDRLDGHFVQGHVDGVGRIRRFAPEGEDWWLEVAAPPEMLRGMLKKGSITVDGISLTVATLADDAFACTIIPHTREVTNLRDRRAGDAVNLETDVLGKWVARLFAAQGGPGA